MVQKCKDTAATIKFLKNMHYTIMSGLRSKLTAANSTSPLIFKCSYEEFSSSLHKSDLVSVNLMFCQMLRNVKGVGKETIQKILSRFKSFKDTFQFLNSDSRNVQEVKEFLELLNKDQKPRFVKYFVHFKPEELL